MSSIIATVCSIMIFGGAVVQAAADGESGRKDPRDLPQTTLHLDLAGQLNPEGLMFTLGGDRRWVREMDKELNIPSSYLQAGATAGSSPAYAKIGAHAEWQPVIFARVRLEYDWYGYFGTNSALLSFPAKDSKFGRSEVKALRGQEETGYGERLLVRPTLFGKIGQVIISNQTDLAYYHLSGRGPYFLEWEYELLLKHRDHVINNRTNFLMNVWKGTGEATLLAGPYVEITRAYAADLTKHRAGGVLFWIPASPIGSLNRLRVYSQVGVYLRDPNLRSEPFFGLGLGADLDR